MFDRIKTLAQAIARITRASAVFAKCDLDFAALTDDGAAEDGLQKILAQRTASAVDAATSELQPKNDKLAVDLAAAQAACSKALADLEAAQKTAAEVVAAVNTALAAVGIKFVAASAAEISAELPKALQSRITAAATEKLAESGVPTGQLPAQSQGGAMAEDSIEELQKALQATKDPVEAGKIVTKIRALRAKQQAGNN